MGRELRGGVLLVALAATCLSAAGCGPRAPQRPNLLLVTVDTLRPDRLACYGGAEDVGTTVCALADDGTRFVWAFSTAPSTAPAVASILTSRYPRDHRVTQFANTTLADAVPTLAESLAAAGYDTGAFVANPVLNRQRRLHRGFSIYDDRMTRQERNRPGMREREAAELSDSALHWARVAREPWFLWVHYQDPHGPYEPPDAPTAWDPAGAEHLPVLEHHSGWRGIPRYQALSGVWSVAAYERRYADEIRYLDRHLARLLTGTAREGARPAVLLTADHGEAFGEDEFYFAHGHSVGLEQVRVPLLWRPAVPGPARVVESPVSTVDVAPTLLRAAGVEPPPGFAGRELPVFDDPLPADERPIFSEHRMRVAVVAGRAYYARDRRELAEPARDRISGGVLPGLPPRTARLGADGEWPAYEDPRAAGAALEAVVGRYLAHEAEGETGGAERELDADTREALRALGYLE